MKKIGACLLTLLLAAVIAVPVQARTFTGDDWTVTFTRQDGLQSDFKTSDINDLILGMQPGDQAVVTLTLRNSGGDGVNWYMSNKVLSSLEDSRDTANGGAYSYRLVYTDPQGAENVLFDSDTVGGDNVSVDGPGLNEATDSLKDYFYLDSMSDGQSGAVILTVALEGETQGNGYQDTLADLQMNFAVATDPDSGDPGAPGGPNTVVMTGDVNMLPFIIAAAVSGALLLAYAIYSLWAQRKKRKGR